MRPDLYYNLASDLCQHLCPTCHYSWNTQLKLHHIFRLTRFRQRKWLCNKYSFGLNVCLHWGRQFKHPDVENESDLRHPGHAWEPVVKLPFHMMETGRVQRALFPQQTWEAQQIVSDMCNNDLVYSSTSYSFLFHHARDSPFFVI